MTSDKSTRQLRRYLRSKNYDAHGWNLGRNHGFGTAGYNIEHLAEHIEDVAEQSGRPVSLIGWSLGGLIVREYAKLYPEYVRQVITLGSPLQGAPKNTVIYSLYSRFSNDDINSDDAQEVMAAMHHLPEDVPCTSIFSKMDGIVPWKYSVQPKGDYTDNIEVYGAHIGLGVNPSVFIAVADRLAQPEGEWAPFDRTANPWRPLLYPSSGHNYRL